jgi:hypothetical protein
MDSKKRAPSKETFDHTCLWWNDGTFLEIPSEWNTVIRKKGSHWGAAATQSFLLSRYIHTSQRRL